MKAEKSTIDTQYGENYEQIPISNVKKSHP